MRLQPPTHHGTARFIVVLEEPARKSRDVRLVRDAQGVEDYSTQQRKNSYERQRGRGVTMMRKRSGFSACYVWGRDFFFFL